MNNNNNTVYIIDNAIFLNSVAAIAQYVIDTEPADVEIEITENHEQTGYAIYELCDDDDLKITPRIYNDDTQPDLHFPEEYNSAEGLCALINEEIAKLLAA
jgi:hypothetical protein